MENWINDLPETERDKVNEKYTKAKTIEEKTRILMQLHPKGYVNLEPIKNLEEYFRYIRISTNSTTWFRGESLEHEYIIPKIYRGANDEKVENLLIKERMYLYEFRRRARSIVPNIDVDDIWSWYFLIQHYGGPTRLLDWTNDATVALFFALDTNRDSKENAVVITILPTTLTEYAYKDIDMNMDAYAHVLYPRDYPTNKWIGNIASETSDIPNSPIAILPSYLEPRITAQSSCFTLFGKHTNGFYKDNKQITCPCCNQRVINKIVIDGNKRDYLRYELSKIGVTSGKVYPGLEGLNKEIAQEIFKDIK